MDDQKNIKPDFSKAGEDSILYKKEEPKTEREKLKELHGKDKIWYLVHYYGLQTIVALAIIGIISFLIIHYVTQKDTALEIMAVNAMQAEDNPAGNSGYYNDFLKENGLDPDKSEVLVTYVQVLAQANMPSRKVRLRGFDPAKKYRLEGTDEVYSGEMLMNAGFRMKDFWGDFVSRLYHFVAVD